MLASLPNSADERKSGIRRLPVSQASTFLHLHLHTPYSLLDGGSSIEDLVRMASRLGMPALACTDHNSLAASVKFVERCRKFGIKPILGAELTMEDDTHLTLLCRNTE